MNERQRPTERRIAALSPEKRALYFHILEHTDLVCATDLLGLTNHRALWAEYVAKQLSKFRR